MFVKKDGMPSKIPNYNNASPIYEGDDLVTRGNMLMKIR
jgi:hypothetical protein